MCKLKKQTKNKSNDLFTKRKKLIKELVIATNLLNKIIRILIKPLKFLVDEVNKIRLVKFLRTFFVFTSATSKNKLNF